MMSIFSLDVFVYFVLHFQFYISVLEDYHRMTNTFIEKIQQFKEKVNLYFVDGLLHAIILFKDL